MSEWTDERIERRATQIRDKLIWSAPRGASSQLYYVAALERLIGEMRDDMQARIAEVEGECERRHYETCRYYVAKLIEHRQEHHEVVGRYAAMIIKLRAKMPDAQTRKCLQDAITLAELDLSTYDLTKEAERANNAVHKSQAWLDSLEANEPTPDLSEFRGMWPHDPDGPSSEARAAGAR